MILLLILIAFACLLFLWGFVADPTRVIARYKSTGLNSHFTIDTATPFPDYLRQSRDMIKQARLKNFVDASQQAILDNMPQALFPTDATCKSANGKFKKGIVLIHGLLDSPYPMHELGKYFQNKCFVVYTILLPGHGTSPGDLRDVNFHDWIAATNYAVKKLQEQVDDVYLLGYSLGGSLAINEALNNSSIKALILFAPPLKMATSLQPLIKPLYWLGRLIPRLQWWEYDDDDVNVRYISYPVNAAYQTLLLMEKVNREFAEKNLSTPIFMEQSAEDATVDSNAGLKFFAATKNPSNRLLWFTQYGKIALQDSRIIMQDSSLLSDKIISLSHTAMFVPATDKIYGQNGSFRDCTHYKRGSAVRLQCKTTPDNYKGEVTDANLDKYTMQRLTYNPFNAELFKQLDLFLDEVNRER